MNPRTALPAAPIVGRRIDYLVELCTNKRILHLGCVDAGLLAERIDSGAHLHLRLGSVTRDLFGIDIDPEGIAALRRMGFDRLAVGDICEAGTLDALDPQDFDIVLASEVLEHLSDPGRFLRSLHGWMAGSTAELVVTVPNAFRIATLLDLWKGVELVHPDHNYWFSYVTIRNVLEKSGFGVESIALYTNESIAIVPVALKRLRGSIDASSPPEGVRTYLRRLPRRLLARTLLRRTPFWADGVIAAARPRRA
jgi:SAM-dependent methyltransferase